ncbi:MAG: hypothetical protein IPK72_19545 [Candidatus Eisenbacteria bacterium]|nr:hypothetical protein [Candidatus Eisenbacteria bacterium]
MKPQLSPELRLLAHLELEPEVPTLDFLHRIIREHQLRVPFETLTKLIDYEPGRARGDFMPSMEEYVDRIITRGAGGSAGHSPAAFVSSCRRSVSTPP